MKIALLGIWHVHAADYLKKARENGAEILGAWDPDKKMLEDFCEKYDVKAFTSREEMLLSPADGVICCSSTDRHKEDLIAAAEAGKNIFTEKVLALTSEECEAIDSAVKKAGVRFVISLFQKSLPQHITAKKLADEGKIGKINYFRFRNCHNGSTGNWLPEHFFRLSQCGGGAMIDLGAHGMYLLDWFLGLPESGKSVFTIADTNPRNIDSLEDNAVSVFAYKDGCIGINETGFDTVGCPARLEIGGEKGYIVAEGECVTLDNGNGPEAVSLEASEPLPIVQFVTGAILPGYGMEEAKHLTKLMEMAYKK